MKLIFLKLKPQQKNVGEKKALLDEYFVDYIEQIGARRSPIWKGRGCSLENFNYIRKGDQSGRGSNLTGHPRDITYIWNDSVFLLFVRVHPERYNHG